MGLLKILGFLRIQKTNMNSKDSLKIALRKLLAFYVIAL